MLRSASDGVGSPDGWLWIQDQGAGVQHQRLLDHLARIDRDMVDRAGREKLIGDDAVLAVEVEYVEALDRSADGQSVMQSSA